MSETTAFLDALRLLTRLPVGEREALDAGWLTGATKYFPAAGLVVGLLSALVFSIAGHFWSAWIAAALAVAASVAITGAMHEDGLCDTFDGFGGRTVEQRFAIMKDSRLGCYGALALLFSVLLRVAALASLSPGFSVAALLAAHACARAAAAYAMIKLPHAGDPALTKIAYAPRSFDRTEVALILAFCGVSLLPLAALSLKAALVGLVAAIAVALAQAAQARRLLGGSTGDVLGAVEQGFEIAFLLGVAAVA